MTKPFICTLCFCLLCCGALVAADNSAELAALQRRIDRLEARIKGVEAIRSVKRLQYAYGHYAELGLWHDLADLFADNGVGHYPSGDLGKEGMTMIIVTHQMGFAKEMADRVIFMEKGSFVAQGTPEDFFANQMEHDRIKSFLNRSLAERWKARLKPLDGGKQLQMRGYIGPFFRTQVWHRVE